MGVTSRDVQWLRKSFLLATDNLDDQSLQEFGYTDTIARPFDTSPGGNEVINPLPQFTRHCDIKIKTPLMNTFGIGRWYDETYGQYSQKIYLRFGVPEFTPMSQFFTGFYSYEASLLARTGRASAGIAYYLGRGVGLAVTIFNIPLLLTTVALEAYRFFTQKQSSKFYYFKPAMHLYWNAVTTLVNHYCVNRGIIPRMFTSDQNQTMAAENTYTADDLKRFAQVLEVFDENGQVDMYRYASFAQRRKKAFMDKLRDMLDVSNLDFGALHNNFRSALNQQAQPVQGRAFKEYMDLWLNSPEGNANSSSGSADGSQGESVADTQVNTIDKPDRDGLWKLLQSEWNDGTAFVCFRVNSTGEVSESFSSSTAKSEIEDKINGLASQARKTSFNFSGGNLTGALSGALGAVGDFVGGVADQFNISGLAVLGGAAFVDIPEHWESSTASLPQQSYTIQLIAPYGNALSQLFNMYIPLFMILAGALPRSTGKQSYTAPPLVQLFDKGKQQTRLGIIDSVSVRRGTTNLPFNKHMQAMGIEVTFSIKDLSSIMHMPISQGFSLNPTKGIFDEDTVFSDYMGVLAGLDIDDQIYSFRKFALNLTRYATNWRSWTSSSHMASFLANGTPLRFVSMFYKGIDP
ncbi:hypothetical protein AVU38_gp040 [Ralstonia phage RSL2]|uniref:hypothetical protein n=1 Tax=Ralstonia phage RSL2 TaxID=1585840 RepID=UPI00054A8139|nr:hypothetical protein AVU38_gp040 [Ralstonia phage RSL2]